MIASTNLKRVNEWAWLRGLTNLVHKENRAWWGTRRWWINALIWPLILGGLVANMIFVPTIASLASPEDVALAGGSIAYAIKMGLSVFFEFGVQAVAIGIIILCQDLLVDERQNGVTEWLLTKPVARRAYLLAKLQANVVHILLFLIIIPSLLVYGLFMLRMGSPLPWLPFLSAVGILILHSLFYLTLVLMLGTFFNSRAPILGIALSALLGGNILSGLIKPLLSISPWSLAKMASLVASGVPIPAETLWPPLVSTGIWCILFVLVALVRFERTEI